MICFGCCTSIFEGRDVMCNYKKFLSLLLPDAKPSPWSISNVLEGDFGALLLPVMLLQRSPSYFSIVLALSPLKIFSLDGEKNLNCHMKQTDTLDCFDAVVTGIDNSMVLMGRGGLANRRDFFTWQWSWNTLPSWGVTIIKLVLTMIQLVLVHGTAQKYYLLHLRGCKIHILTLNELIMMLEAVSVECLPNEEIGIIFVGQKQSFKVDFFAS